MTFRAAKETSNSFEFAYWRSLLICVGYVVCEWARGKPCFFFLKGRQARQAGKRATFF